MGSNVRIGTIPLIIIGVLAYLFLYPARTTLRSPEETTKIVASLGRYWSSSSVPVIMFATPG